MTVPVFGVDARTITGSIAQLETLFVVTVTKRTFPVCLSQQETLSEKGTCSRRRRGGKHTLPR